MKVKSESEVAQSCPTLCDPMDCSLPDSSIHGIFQARVLEWGAIAFSEIYSEFLQNRLPLLTYWWGVRVLISVLFSVSVDTVLASSVPTT